MHHFENLCQEAFTRRTGGNIPLVGPLIDNYHHSKYQTTTLESSLKSVFPDDMHLFGGRRRVEFCVSPVKAVVTATSLLGNKTYVLANYNRPREGQIPSKFGHLKKPDLELLSHTISRQLSFSAAGKVHRRAEDLGGVGRTVAFQMACFLIIRGVGLVQRLQRLGSSNRSIIHARKRLSLTGLYFTIIRCGLPMRRGSSSGRMLTSPIFSSLSEPGRHSAWREHEVNTWPRQRKASFLTDFNYSTFSKTTWRPAWIAKGSGTTFLLP